MKYKSLVLSIGVATLLFSGCGSSGSSKDDTSKNDVNKIKIYDKAYYESIDYSDIDKLSTMLLDKDLRFKDFATQIPLAKLTIEVNDQNISFDSIARGMTDDGKMIQYVEEGNYLYQQSEDGNITTIVFVDKKGTEDDADDFVVIEKYDKEHIVESSLYDMLVTTYNADTLKVTYPEALIANGSAIVEYNATSDYAIIKDGDLGVNVFNKMVDITQNYPNIKEIRLKNIDGSVHDAINMQTGFLLRKAGLNTFVIDTEGDDTDIASGGVDLFCAGVERSIENPQTVKLGIHSWYGEDDNGTKAEGRDFPKTHLRHHDQLLYFSKMLGVNDGYDFYFRTLEAASGNNIHAMTEQEVSKYNILTK